MANEIDSKIQQCEADIQKLQDTLKELKTQKEQANIKLYSGLCFHTDWKKEHYVLFSTGDGSWFVAGPGGKDYINFARHSNKNVLDNFSEGSWIKD